MLLLSQLTRILQRCCDSRALSPGKQLHLQIIQHGLDRTPFLLTKLVQFYADCDRLNYAYNLFDKLSQPNVFAWTAILAFFTRNGRFKECLQGYCAMRSVGSSPDGYVFPLVLRACAHLSWLEVGALTHKDAIAFGSVFSLQVCNSLIAMYSKCGNAGCARQIFDEVEFGSADLLSWNSMISGYVSNGFGASAVDLLGAMRLEGIEPDVVTWNSIMGAYCQIGMCDEAFRIFERIGEPNVISWTTLISGFSRIGRHDTSLEIFRDMMSIGKVIPDLDCLSTVMASCRHLNAGRNGRELHAYGTKMHDRDSFYVSAGPALSTVYSGCGEVEAAKAVFKFMDKTDAVAWNALLLGFVDLGMEKVALNLFAEMQTTGIKADQTTISTLLPVCDLRSGRQVHAHIFRNSFHEETLVMNALLCMYSRCGSLNAAQLIFSNMIKRDLVSWNTMVGGFAMHGGGELALQLLEEMKSSRLQPDSVTLTSVLAACSHSGLVDRGLELFRSAVIGEMGVELKIEHVACVVDMLSRAGRLDEAVDLLKQVPVKPSKKVWGTVLAAGRAQNNIEAATLAAENLLVLEPENGGNYISLANAYAGCGRLTDAMRARSMMEDKGVAKPIGSSWIECGKIDEAIYKLVE